MPEAWTAAREDGSGAGASLNLGVIYDEGEGVAPNSQIAGSTVLTNSVASGGFTLGPRVWGLAVLWIWGLLHAGSGERHERVRDREVDLWPRSTAPRRRG